MSNYGWEWGSAEGFCALIMSLSSSSWVGARGRTVASLDSAVASMCVSFALMSFPSSSLLLMDKILHYPL